MYIPEILNAKALFQRVGGWKEKNPLPELNELLYRATSASIHEERLNFLNRKCIEEFKWFEEQLTLDDKLVFSSSTLVELFHEISPFFSTLIRIQNMILPLVGKHLGKTALPSSLSDVMKKLHKFGFPGKIPDLTAEYWRKWGETIKDYRDVDQHFDVLIKQTFLEVTPSKTIVVYLPDNPGVKSPSKFTYTAKINALQFLPKAFRALHEYIENVIAELGFLPTSLDFEVALKQMGDLRPFKNRTLSLMVEKKIRQKSPNAWDMNVTALEVAQNPNGTLRFQNKEIAKEKLKRIKF